MDDFYAAGTVQQAEQPNYLAEGRILANLSIKCSEEVSDPTKLEPLSKDTSPYMDGAGQWRVLDKGECWIRTQESILVGGVCASNSGMNKTTCGNEWVLAFQPVQGKE
eukprot:1143655-Pelagomonas_calceolata.AAC.6